ncbi:MAG: hypothetical protein AABW79_02430 [Nanoarchaeota archaeon]
MIQWRTLEEGRKEICDLIVATQKKVKPAVVALMGWPNSGKTYLGYQIERSFPQLTIFHTESDLVVSADCLFLGLSPERVAEQDVMLHTTLPERAYPELIARRFGISGMVSDHFKEAFGREPDIRAYITRNQEICLADKESIERGHYNLVIYNPDAKIK